jgi:hypothetical protein
MFYNIGPSSPRKLKQVCCSGHFHQNSLEMKMTQLEYFKIYFLDTLTTLIMTLLITTLLIMRMLVILIIGDTKIRKLPPQKAL